jgi:DNA-binding GntR family transcriptional regulator
LQPTVGLIDQKNPSLVVDSIADQLYRILCDRIINGAISPGSRLDLQAVAAEFGVSRTPVRDALFRLERDRLVETRPRSGTYVARPTTRDIHEVCQVRKGIEWVATGAAALSMPLTQIQDLRDEAVEALEQADKGNFEPFFSSDSRIHREIIESTANGRLIDFRASVEPFVHWLRVLGATGTHRLAGSTSRHLEILDAMAARDAEKAQKLAAIHLDEVETWTVADMESRLIKT